MREINFPAQFVIGINKESIQNPVEQDNVAQLIESLPDSHKELLKTLSSFLKEIADNSEKNKMVMSNLSIVFAPNLPFNPKAFELLIEGAS